MFSKPTPDIFVLSALASGYASGRVNLGTGGLDSGPCPAQFFARSPAQRAKRRARTGRK